MNFSISCKQRQCGDLGLVKYCGASGKVRKPWQVTWHDKVIARYVTQPAAEAHYDRIARLVKNAHEKES